MCYAHLCCVHYEGLLIYSITLDSSVFSLPSSQGLGAGTADDTVSSPLAGLPQPKQTEPGLAYPSSGSDTLSNGSRVKLDPLPMPPVSPPPSVFVPFAPDTIAENEPEEIAEQNRVANSDIN